MYMPKGNGKPIPQVLFNTDFPKKELIETLKTRFEENTSRHKGIAWSEVEEKLTPSSLKALSAMESTGGEPDVVGKDSGKFVFMDCSPESPDRRSICYDQAGEDARIKKGIKPGGNAVELAKEMGIELLTEDEYRNLQKLGEFDTKTSSWLSTPKDVRDLGGAIFGDRRYNTTFIFHNGAESFYSDRGFRGKLLL